MFKKLFENRKVICFDLDGTIVDTKQLWHDTYYKVIADLNLGDPHNLDLVENTGTTLESIWESFLGMNQDVFEGELPLEKLLQQSKEAFKELLEERELEPLEGFWPFFAELKMDKKKKIAIVTNTPAELAKKVLEKLGIAEESIDLIVYGDDVKEPKPDPEMYKKVIKHFKVNPKQILVFEDSIPGATAAEKAGLDLVIVWNGEVKKIYYPGNIFMFTDNFSHYPGNMDMSKRDVWDDFVKKATAYIKSKQ